MIHKLKASQIKNLNTGSYNDGGGLYLIVQKSGSRSWTLRFMHPVSKKRSLKGLGGYPAVSLSKAREIADKLKAEIARGVDPFENKLKQKKLYTFSECATEFIASKKSGWKNSKHVAQWTSTLTSYAYPLIGKKNVQDIDTEDILRVLNPIWTEKTETAKRVQGRIENILDYASAKGLRDLSNPCRWRGHLDKILANPNKLKKIRHHPAMPYEEIAVFMEELSQKRSVSSKALRFLILTATRTSEVIYSKWNEINFEKAIWTIPAERTKTKMVHEVPLSNDAIELLKSLNTEKDNPYIFVGNRIGKSISNNSLLKLMNIMGYASSNIKGAYVPHGFRSTFRDWAGNISNAPHQVAEMALGHAIANKTEAAYRRRTMLEKRREMMEAWAYFVSRKEAKVVSISGGL